MPVHKPLTFEASIGNVSRVYVQHRETMLHLVIYDDRGETSEIFLHSDPVKTSNPPELIAEDDVSIRRILTIVDDEEEEHDV